MFEGASVHSVMAHVKQRRSDQPNTAVSAARYGQPEEVAGLVRFLASDPAAAYITGQVGAASTAVADLRWSTHYICGAPYSWRKADVLRACWCRCSRSTAA
jgi:hypothetical protein